MEWKKRREGAYYELEEKSCGIGSTTGTVRARKESGSVDAEFVQTVAKHTPTNDLSYSAATLSTTIRGAVVGMTLYKAGYKTKRTSGKVSSISYRALNLVNLIAAGYDSDGGDSGGVVWHYDSHTKMRSTIGIHTGGPKAGYSGPAFACKASEITAQLFCYRY